MNLFGLDVRALDVAAFLAAARHAFPLLALAWLVLVVRRRRPGLLLLGVVLANAYAWLETNWPLQRVYALGPSSDRVNNLAMCQVVAAGHSPLHTPQVGQMHFEPFWSMVTAIASGWSPSRLLVLYPFFPLVMACGFALSLYFALRPLTSPGEGDVDEAAWSGWERALIALFATLLSSTALDYAGPYRVPWAMTFLLKPNHALGLILFPWVLRGFARIRGARGAVLVGILLHVLGWAFVIHMGAVCVGLVSLVLLDLALGGETRRDLRDVAIVIGVNLLVVSPYLVMLFSGYRVFQASARMEIPPASPHLLEALTRLAGLSALAAWGLVVAWRRDRMGRVWAGQAVGALLIWLAYYPLALLQQAKERDDTYYWLRIQLAAAAAIGAWDLARRVLPVLAPCAWPPARRAALVAGLAIPLALPYWWDPSRMDLYFPGSLTPVPAMVAESATLLRAEGRGPLTVAGDPTAARWMAALAGTRVTLARDFAKPRDAGARVALNETLVRGGPGDPLADAARWGVTHLIVTPEFLAAYGVSLEALEGRPYLRRVHLSGDPGGDYVGLFALARTPS
jgi:hypothetical protein